jgi:putative ABC transport system substrate-binding protein
MHRRRFIALLGGAITLPCVAAAQQKAMPVIGYLDPGSPGPRTAFREGLIETGYVEGQTVAIEVRGAEFRYDRLPALAADLVGRKVDVIVTAGTPAALAAKSVTSTIPIVFFSGDDPVALGLVASFPRPGGNLTGFTAFFAELMPKRLELISELVPQAGMIALLVNQDDPTVERLVQPVQDAARAKGLQLRILSASTESEIKGAFASLVQLHAGALIVTPNAFFGRRREQIVALAARDAVPAIYVQREFAVAGGLISYGPSLTAVFRQLGIYAGKILKGAKPADLPVQQPTIFELVVNLKTAKALGLTIPPSILARADEVIE